MSQLNISTNQQMPCVVVTAVLMTRTDLVYVGMSGHTMVPLTN